MEGTNPLDFAKMKLRARLPNGHETAPDLIRRCRVNISSGSREDLATLFGMLEEERSRCYRWRRCCGKAHERVEASSILGKLVPRLAEI